MSENQYERAKGNLYLPKEGEEWSGELRLVGVDTRQRKDGGSFESWWALVRLVTDFKGTNADGDINIPYKQNDLVFTNIRGVHAVRELEDVCTEQAVNYKRGRWAIPDETQVIITFSRVKSKTSGRSYYTLKAEVH